MRIQYINGGPAWMLSTRMSYFCSEKGGYVDIAKILNDYTAQ